MSVCVVAAMLLLVLLPVDVLAAQTDFADAATYSNPTQSVHDSPDPGVILINNTFFAVTTGGFDGKFFPVWQSSDTTKWTQAGWAMPSPPAWTTCCDYWAPELQVVNGKLMLYYTARSASAAQLSIGVAVSSSGSPLGPWNHQPQPLWHEPSLGAIDPTITSDNGTTYLVWKVDGNAVGQSTPIYAAALDATGQKVVGNPILLITDDQPWENGLVEGPWIAKPANSSFFYLFFSGCGYASTCYGIGVARAPTPLGPYVKYSGNPILHTRKPETSMSFEGPGHCSVVARHPTKAGAPWIMVYHAWPHNAIGTQRMLMTDTVDWSSPDQWPRVAAGYPSETPQPSPPV